MVRTTHVPPFCMSSTEMRFYFCFSSRPQCLLYFTHNITYPFTPNTETPSSTATTRTLSGTGVVQDGAAQGTYTATPAPPPHAKPTLLPTHTETTYATVPTTHPAHRPSPTAPTPASPATAPTPSGTTEARSPPCKASLASLHDSGGCLLHRYLAWHLLHLRCRFRRRCPSKNVFRTNTNRMYAKIRHARRQNHVQRRHAQRRRCLYRETICSESTTPTHMNERVQSGSAITVRVHL